MTNVGRRRAGLEGKLTGSADRHRRVALELITEHHRTLVRYADGMGTWVRPGEPGPVFAPVAPRIRHVWVEHPGGHGQTGPGLVIAWRMERQPSSLAAGWSAQVAVVWAVDRLSIEWVRAERLRPAVDASDVPPGS